MSSFQFAGTVSHGTLRTYDLIFRFMNVLRVLDPEQAARWSDDERRYLNALDGTYAKDPEYTQADVDELQEESVEFLVTLQDALNEVAPAGYRFGAHEGDGSDFGFWRMDEDPVDVVRDFVPDNHDQLKGKRHVVYIDITAEVKGGFVPSLVYEGVAGHFPLAGHGAFASPWVWGPTFGDAQHQADEMNARLGYTPGEALDILLSSMHAQIVERRRTGRDE